MPDDPIPDDVRQFILDKIDSVAELEALLLLSRNPETGWRAETLAQGLYTSAEQTEYVLERLCEQDFLKPESDDPLEYRYRPATPKLAKLVNRTAEIYQKYLVPVTNLIHSKPDRIQQFADAFRLRKKGEDD